MLTFIITNLEIIQIIILSLVGAFIGELFRSVACPVRFLPALAEFLASALFAFMFTVGARELGLKNKSLLAVLDLYTGFVGFRVTEKHARRIFNNFISVVTKDIKKGKDL